MADNIEHPRLSSDKREPGEIFLSIVIPAYNEEHRLPRTLEEIFDFLDKQSYSAEVLVVDNGSEDRTAAVAKSFTKRFDSLRVLREERGGKGMAVRTGMLNARGSFRFLCDADLSMPIHHLSRFLPPALSDVDVGIGSREARESIVVDKPHRRLIGRTYNAVARLLGLTTFRDTQCGFKCFRAGVAEDIFRRQRVGGLGFDVEILYIARLRGYRVVEVPISWYTDPDSRVRLFHDSIRMGLDLLKVWRNGRTGLYDIGPDADKS